MAGEAPEIEASGRQAEDKDLVNEVSWDKFQKLLSILKNVQVAYILIFLFAVFTQEQGMLGLSLWWKFASNLYIPIFIVSDGFLDLAVITLLVLGIMKLKVYLKLIETQSHKINRLVIYSSIKALMFFIAAGSLGLYIFLIETASIILLVTMRKKT